MFLYLGLAYYFSGGQPFILPLSGAINNHSSPWTVFVILMAITGSFMVSYTRARAEGLGIDCKVGLMQRPERILLLIIGSLLGVVPKVGPLLLKFALLLLAVSSNITAIHRIVYISKKILKENRVS
jgi:CDP-diacylglycerol--glycerol-3-phosphate 3-phosphatidyltransferase